MSVSRRGWKPGKGRIGARAWVGLAAVYVALIFFVSSRPYLHAPGPEFHLKDKLAHGAEYAILGALLALAVAHARTVRSRAVAFMLVLAIGATIAAADEMFQGTVPGRQRDVADWIADVCGVAIGAGIAPRLVRREDPLEEQER